MKNKEKLEKIVEIIGEQAINIATLDEIVKLQEEIIKADKITFKDQMAMIGSAYESNRITQNFQGDLRKEMEEKMQNLWGKYYDKMQKFANEDKGE